ncbi:RNA polymerase sigma factor [Lacisediminihabitans sp.]|uniref:RNA polymerase sigma factor n=1 Tax=Lacisediminihabitans sp. TaxID=2787631 RepID=UPI00374CBA58
MTSPTDERSDERSDERFAASAVASASAEETARIVSTLIRVTGDWALAEDCVQDAFARALVDWPVHGIPSKPGAWLTTVAKNAAIDRLRRFATERAALRQLAIMAELEGLDSEGSAGSGLEDDALEDDRLRLIFTCCHPALPMDARVALTLRTVAGLTTGEIARAFLVSESTMAKRLVRARAKIRDAGIPYRVPPPRLLPGRTAGVFAVLYLLFNEGYSATGDRLVREPLAREAIRLTRLLVQLLGESPHTSEALGLLALMLFQHARTAARLDSAGDVVTLEHQDRSLWDADAVAEGLALLRTADRRCLERGERPGRYQLQAAIAGCHLVARDAASTDFARVAVLYEALALIAPSPVVELNRAVAVAMSQGAEAGLALVDALDRAGSLDGYYLLPATRADLLRRLGRTTEAARDYRRARDLAPSEVERRYLSRRLAEGRGSAAERSFPDGR